MRVPGIAGFRHFKGKGKRSGESGDTAHWSSAVAIWIAPISTLVDRALVECDRRSPCSTVRTPCRATWRGSGCRRAFRVEVQHNLRVSQWPRLVDRIYLSVIAVQAPRLGQQLSRRCGPGIGVVHLFRPSATRVWAGSSASVTWQGVPPIVAVTMGAAVIMKIPWAGVQRYVASRCRNVAATSGQASPRRRAGADADQTS